MKTKHIKTKIDEALSFMQNDTQKAIEIFDEILDIHPENIDAINGKGSSLMKLNNMDEAEKYFNYSLSIKKTSSALISKGIISKNRKEYENAIYFYDEAIQLNPDLNNIINILKNEIIDISDNEVKIISNFDEDINELINKGLECKKLNRLWDALDYYEKAIKLDESCKNSVEALINEIKSILQDELLIKTPKIKNTQINQMKIKSLRLLLIEENPMQALTIMNLILKIDENEIDTLNQKGCILFLNDDFQGAIECFDKCLSIDENYHYALFNKALVLRRTNELQKALNHFDELLKIPQLYDKVKPYQLEILDKLHEESKN